MKTGILFIGLLFSMMSLRAQSPLHLNGYDLCCMVEKKGNEIIVNNFSDHILDQHYPILPLNTGSLIQFKDSNRRQEFLDNLGLTTTVLDANQFYSTPKYDFYDSLHHRAITHIADKIINRLQSNELNGRMVLVGPRSSDVVDDELSDTGNQKKLIKSENGLLTYLLIGLVLLFASLAAYLWYDRKRKSSNLVSNDTPKLTTSFPDASDGISNDAKKLFDKIENETLKKEFIQFFAEVKQELVSQQTKFSQAEQKWSADITSIKNTNQANEEILAQDKLYANAAFDKLAKPLLDYFETHQNYPLDEEGRKILIAGLLKLSFHMISYLKVKRASADQFDRSNIDELLGLPVSESLLKKTNIKPVYGDIPLFVHHICDLMLHNGLEDLEGVNVKSYKISSKA